MHVREMRNGHVLDVGDSHTWLGGAGRQYPRWDSDSRPGRRSPEGVGTVEELLRRRHRIVVFDLGTNDVDNPRGLRASLRELHDREHLDGRELVLVDVYRVSGSQAGVNRVIRGFASHHQAHVHVVRWERYVRRHPEQVSDGVHFTTEGYEHRTKKIRRKVQWVRRHLRRSHRGRRTDRRPRQRRMSVTRTRPELSTGTQRPLRGSLPR